MTGKKCYRIPLMSSSSSQKQVQWLTVDPEQDGQRLDNFLIRRLRGVPRSRIYRIIRRGEVRVNSGRSRPDHKLTSGDKVRVPPYSGPDAPQPDKPSPDLARRLTDAVLHEEDAFLALNKPAGLTVHGGSSIRLGIIEALRQIRPQWRDAELVHRLDRDTSGVLLIAKTAAAMKDLQAQFKARTVHKTYLALVHGRWDEAVKEVTAPLRKREQSGGEWIVRVAPTGKPSLTRFRVRRHYPAATLLEAMPETGRTHQIRVHCQYAGHPIVGDPKYTPAGQAKAPDALKQAKHLCLHAAALEFNPPDTASPIRMEAALDPHFAAILEALDAPSPPS